MAKIPDGWTEIKEPTLMKFDSIGDSVKGVLLDLRHEVIKDSEKGTMEQVLTARMELENGEQVKFRPSYDLREKLGKRLLGKELYILYESDDAATKAKGNSMKKFRVLFNPGGGTEAPLIATDTDVPTFA